MTLVNRRTFLKKTGGAVLAGAAGIAVACDASTEDPRNGPAGEAASSFEASFEGDGDGWGPDWLNVRYETRLERAQNAGTLTLEPPARKGVEESRGAPAYMGAPVLVADRYFGDVEVTGTVIAEGPAEVGVVARAGYDVSYAVVSDGDELLLVRYRPEDRNILDRSPLPRTGEPIKLELEVRGSRLRGKGQVGGRSATTEAEDPDPLPPGMVGVVANPRTPDVGADIRVLGFSAEGAASGGNGILYRFTGAVGADRARVTARAVVAAPLTFELADEPDFRDPEVQGPIDPAGALGAVHASFENLAPDRRYYWRPVLQTQAGTVRGPAASFRTAPPPGDAVRCVFASCTSGLERRYPSFDSAAALEPHFYLHAGDWGYADANSYVRRADHFQGRWVRLFRTADLSRLLESTPLLFWQDDHDYAADNGWKETVQGYAVRSFDELHANPAAEYFDFRFGDLHVWCLDCRLYADDPSLPDTTSKSRLGPEQKRWLLEGLTASDAPVQLIASPMVFRNKDKDDPGWHSVYTAERDELLAFFAGLDSTVVILSGDSHGHRLIHHREFGELYEVTASGTDFPAGVGQENNDPEHTPISVDGRSGFALVELEPAGPERNVTVRAIEGATGEEMFRHSFPVGG